MVSKLWKRKSEQCLRLITSIAECIRGKEKVGRL